MKMEKTPPIININTAKNKVGSKGVEHSCANPSYFFCTVKERDLSLRRAGIASCFREMPLRDSQEDVLVLSGLWNIAMTQPNDPEFPSLGIFKCMASLINRGITEKSWLLSNQNIYIPYYAAHVIGSYTMNKAEFAVKAVESDVIPSLMELLRGKISWVEQRVAIRALGHLASYKRTFEAVAVYENEIVNLAMQLASTCLEVVYNNFVGLRGSEKRLKYHSDLLTRGVGGLEMENRKAEEWASQLQCWSLHLLNCFASKGMSLDLICRQDFLKDLAQMWGGLSNQISPAGVGLLRILCYSKVGRKNVAESKEVIEKLCRLSKSSDDWQYMGIDCLLLLLKDQDTRYKVIETATLCLVDLVELRSLGGRSNVGDAITTALLLDYKQINLKLKNKEIEKVLEEVWDLKIERRKRQKMLSEEKAEEKRVLVGLKRQQGNRLFWSGEIEAGLVKYSEALDLCPLRFKKERMVLYSNRAQCHLLLRDPDAAISDSTRALCLSNPANTHRKSLWRRSQAYDMKGFAKESLMDCIIFLNGFINHTDESTKRAKNIPYYAVRMISKQMDATWIFANARSKFLGTRVGKVQELDGDDDCDCGRNSDKQARDDMIRIMMEEKGFISGLPTIIEEPFSGKQGKRRKLGMARRRRRGVVARSM